MRRFGKETLKVLTAMNLVGNQLRVTIARLSDHRLVAGLCRRAVGREDYVLSILREVIADKGLYLAWNGTELAGMTNFEKCVDGTGWLSMARTDPTWRSRGVALFLQQHISTYAKRKGIRILRLWTSSKNRPAIRACTKGGFRRVCEASYISCNLRSTRPPKRLIPLSRASETQLKSFLKSSYVSKMNGYLPYKWQFMKASKQPLETLLSNRELYLTDEVAFILTKPERIFNKQLSSFTLLNGPTATLLRIVKQAAKGLHAEITGSYIPHDTYLLRVARRVGFKVTNWGKHCIIFEKTLS